MAKVCTIHVGVRWWVRPYLWLAAMAWHTVAPFADDEQRDSYISRHAAFVGRRGTKITFRPVA